MFYMNSSNPICYQNICIVHYNPLLHAYINGRCKMLKGNSQHKEWSQNNGRFHHCTKEYSNNTNGKGQNRKSNICFPCQIIFAITCEGIMSLVWFRTWFWSQLHGEKGDNNKIHSWLIYSRLYIPPSQLSGQSSSLRVLGHLARSFLLLHPYAFSVLENVAIHLLGSDG